MALFSYRTALFSTRRRMSSRDRPIVIDDDDPVEPAQPSLSSLIPDRIQLERERLERVRKREEARRAEEARASPQQPAGIPNIQERKPVPPHGQRVAGSTLSSKGETAGSRIGKRRATEDPPVTWNNYTPKRRATNEKAKPKSIPEENPQQQTVPNTNYSSTRYTPIQSGDRFWRGAIKVRCITHPGNLQSVRASDECRDSARPDSPSCNARERQWTAARSAHFIRCGHRLALDHFPPGACDVHRQSTQRRPSTRPYYPKTRVLRM